MNTDALFAEFGIRCVVDFDSSAPLPLAVWTRNDDGSFGELIGAGETIEVALNDAWTSLKFWQTNS